DDNAGASTPMNRLYVIECTPTITGASADHRLPVPARDVASVARMIAGAVGAGSAPGQVAPALSGWQVRWIDALARDLKAAGARGLVIAGDSQPPEVHALAHLINHALGAVGRTITFIDRVDAGPAGQLDSLGELAADINAGAVDTLLI